MNEYVYTGGILRTIAKNYTDMESTFDDVNLLSLAEYKADFDRAVDSLSDIKWSGVVPDHFSEGRYLGILQQVVLADIMGITDDELSKMGLWKKLKDTSYFLMAQYLNGGKDE